MTSSKTVEQRAELEEAKAEAEEIVDKVIEYDTRGNFYVAEITKIKQVDGDEIGLEVDVPHGCSKWTYDIPYEWDESNFFVRLAEKRGYGKGNFHGMIGDEVLIKPKKGGYWDMVETPPSRYDPPENLREKLREKFSMEQITIIALFLLSVFLASLVFL